MPRRHEAVWQFQCQHATAVSRATLSGHVCKSKPGRGESLGFVKVPFHGGGVAGGARAGVRSGQASFQRWVRRGRKRGPPHARAREIRQVRPRQLRQSSASIAQSPGRMRGRAFRDRASGKHRSAVARSDSTWGQLECLRATQNVSGQRRQGEGRVSVHNRSSPGPIAGRVGAIPALLGPRKYSQGAFGQRQA